MVVVVGGGGSLVSRPHFSRLPEKSSLGTRLGGGTKQLQEGYVYWADH